MKLPTSSTLHRWLNCDGPALLDHHETPVGPAAQRGNAIHRFLRNVQRAVDPFDGVDDKYVQECTNIDVGPVRGDVLEVESSYAMTFDGKVDVAYLGEDLDRAYPELRAIFGTTDQVRRVDGVLTVVDWKTGQPLGNDIQLKFMAACVRRKYGMPDRVDGVYMYLEPDGTWSADPYSYDAFDLEVFERQLGQRLLALEGTKAPSLASDVAEGTWCRYCPSMGQCPAARAHSESALTSAGVDLSFDYSPIIESAEHAAWLYKASRLVDPLTETVVRSIKTYADKHGLSVDGKRYVKLLVEKGSISAPKLEALARQRGATDEEIAACRSRYTFEQHRLVK